jgi:hypothetical protein
MRAGRRRKSGKRERNGRAQRPPVVVRDVRDVALSQPHRRGSNDPFLESPLGRFVLCHKLDRLVYDAALGYAKLVRRIFAIRGIPQGCGDGHKVLDTGREMTAETARCLQDRLDQVERRLRSVSRDGLNAARQLAVFEREVSLSQADGAALILRELLTPSR